MTDQPTKPICTMLKKPRPCKPWTYGCGGNTTKPCENRKEVR